MVALWGQHQSILYRWPGDQAAVTLAVNVDFFKIIMPEINFEMYYILLFYIREFPYMVVGSSMSRKVCDEVFLNGHIMMVVG